ncbi:MAG: DVUA0089 family protein [Anaerolineae bacterium]
MRYLLATLLMLTLGVSGLAQSENSGLISEGVITGTITDDNPVDRYRFEAFADQQVIITMEAEAGSNLDAALNLFDGSGVLLQTDDDSAGNRNSRITFTPTVSGIYTIEATRYPLNPPLTTGAYRLTLSYASDETTNMDPLSIPPDFAVPFEIVAPEDTVPASFTTGDDRQYLVIGAQQGEFVRVELTTNDSLNARVRMLTRINQRLSVISRIAQSNNNSEVIFATIPQTGWYLIEIERTEGIGGYTVTPAVISDTLLSVQTPIQTRLTRDDTVQLFVFNGTINERVFVNLRVLNGSGLQPEISIYDLNQTLLEQQSSGGAQVRANLTIPRSSPYIVELRNVGFGSGEVELQLRRVPVNIEKLPIRPASYNERFVGLIRDEAPIEYFSFNGKAGELVTVEMNALAESSLLDPYLILADSTLNELIFNDNIGASRSARIVQFALPADGTYFILATRADLSRGTTTGAYALTITVGEVQLESGQLTATLTWEGEADLNLFLRPPNGAPISWANPGTGQSGRLQIDSNTRCETPTAQPIEHIYWQDASTLTPGDYTVWVWYQNSCMMSAETPFTLTLNYRGETLLAITSNELETVTLNDGQRFEASIRVTNEGEALVVNRGSTSTPSPQQTASQGGDTLIVYGDTLSGRINDAVFAQFYQFEGNAGDTIAIRAERITNDLDPLLVLRNGLDVTIATNDDISPQDRNAQIIYTLPESGRYVIAVTRYGVRDGTTSGNYSLSLNRIAVPTLSEP